jgi:hypothetical protein
MHRPEITKENEVEILCNKPNQKTKPTKTNAWGEIENFIL